MEKLLSLVVPAFNEEEAMEQSFERTYRAMSSIGYPFEIIYIDDGSRDRTWEIISRLAREHEEVKALRFSRNFGHQLAVTAGMDEAKGDAVIIMDADYILIRIILCLNIYFPFAFLFSLLLSAFLFS